LSKVAAKNSKIVLYFGTPTPAPVAFAEVRSYSLQVSKGSIDVSVLSTDWKEYLSGQREWKGTLELYWNPADGSAEKQVNTILMADGGLRIGYRPEGAGAGLPEFVGDAVITEWNLAGATNDAVGVSLSFQGNGALEEEAQSA